MVLIELLFFRFVMYIAAFCGKNQRWDSAWFLQEVSNVCHLLLKEKWKLSLGPFLCSIKHANTAPWAFFFFFLRSCELLTSAVLFTSIFHMSHAACEAALRHSINICWVNELTFLKGQSCKRGSSLKVYNLENINYVEMVCDGLKEHSRKTKQNSQ